MNYVEAIAAVTLHNMKKDDRVFVLGEEVANLHGGPYRATRGIKEVFPERLINTPISECGFVGMAGGAAMAGLRPVVEIMFPDFALVACDQLFNQIGKLRHMYGGQARFPLVARTRVAIGQGYGGQHSMNPVGLFGLFSGWRIVAPSNPFDYIGLFNTAMRFNDPVLIVEHADLYEKMGRVPIDNLDYFVAYGKARVVRPGRDVTCLTYLTGVNDSLKAAEELARDGLDVEVIDLRTLDYSGIDFDTIGRSLEKTGLVLILEQVPRSMGLAGRISDEIQERFYDLLDGPVEKITAADVPPPVSRALETAMLPDGELIKRRLRMVGKA
jgi:2-oxoisovalerate dehydrogenase E1 component